MSVTDGSLHGERGPVISGQPKTHGEGAEKEVSRKSKRKAGARKKRGSTFILKGKKGSALRKEKFQTIVARRGGENERGYIGGGNTQPSKLFSKVRIPRCSSRRSIVGIVEDSSQKGNQPSTCIWGNLGRRRKGGAEYCAVVEIKPYNFRPGREDLNRKARLQGELYNGGL